MKRDTNFIGISIITFALLLSSLFTSCGDGKELTEGSAKKALKKLTALKDSSMVVQLATGYFEIENEDTRLAYRKLARAGMINYKMSVIIDQEKRGGWYYSYTEDVPHYFVTVSLTEEGKKYIVYNPVEEDEDKDLKEEEDNTTYPEDGEYPSDIWKAPGSKSVNETSSDDSNEETTSASRSGSTSLSPYHQALSKVNVTEYNMLAAFIKINKVRNIRCIAIEGKAIAEVIFEWDKITPFGRICSNMNKGEKMSREAKFIRYEDKGWEADMEKL